MKEIIITSGGTSENIDSVRKITNNSSGKLGSIIANIFAENYQKNFEKIYYVCSKNSVKPNKNNKIEIIEITNVDSLKNTMENLLKTKDIDCVIHSMAVSDYTTNYVSNADIFAENLENLPKNKLKTQVLSKNLAISAENKISSCCDNLIVILKQTPKIINLIKKIKPNLTLVGFKLVVNKTEEELTEIATNLMDKNGCDFVLANDLKNINQNNHYAFILDKNLNKTFCTTKQEIAQNLAHKLF